MPSGFSTKSMYARETIPSSSVMAKCWNAFDLATLREDALEGTVAGFETQYWFDGTPLAEL